MNNIFKNPTDKFKELTYIKKTKGDIWIHFLNSDKNKSTSDIYTISNNSKNILPVANEILDTYGLFSMESARAFVEAAYDLKQCNVVVSALSNVFNNPNNNMVYYCIKYIHENEEEHHYGTFIIPRIHENDIDCFIDSTISEILVNLDIKE